MGRDRREFLRHPKRTDGAGIQEPVPRRNFREPPGKQRTTRDPAGRRGASPFQNSSARRPRGDPDRSDDSRAVAHRGDRLLRTKNERDLRPRLGASAGRRDNHQRPLRAVARRPLPNCFPPPTRLPGRGDVPGNGAGVLEPIRTVCPQESGAMALDVQALALSAPRRRARGISVLCEYLPGFRTPVGRTRPRYCADDIDGHAPSRSNPVSRVLLTKPATCAFPFTNYETPFPPFLLPLCRGCDVPDKLRNPDGFVVVAQL